MSAGETPSASAVVAAASAFSTLKRAAISKVTRCSTPRRGTRSVKADPSARS